jgi:hypothetical protein
LTMRGWPFSKRFGGIQEVALSAEPAKHSASLRCGLHSLGNVFPIQDMLIMKWFFTTFAYGPFCDGKLTRRNSREFATTIDVQVNEARPPGKNVVMTTSQSFVHLMKIGQY